MRYEQAFGGEWIRIKRRGQRIACCDCGLVHVMKVSRRKGKVGARFWRHPTATGGVRSGKGIIIVKKK